MDVYLRADNRDAGWARMWLHPFSAEGEVDSTVSHLLRDLHPDLPFPPHGSTEIVKVTLRVEEFEVMNGR